MTGCRVKSGQAAVRVCAGRHDEREHDEASGQNHPGQRRATAYEAQSRPVGPTQQNGQHPSQEDHGRGGHHPWKTAIIGQPGARGDFHGFIQGRHDRSGIRHGYNPKAFDAIGLPYAGQAEGRQKQQTEHGRRQARSRLDIILGSHLQIDGPMENQHGQTYHAG